MNTKTVSDPDEIRRILSDPTWKVKPPNLGVPEGIQGSLAGDIYHSFARMTDGDLHRDLRRITEEIISDLDTSRIERHVEVAFNLFNNPSPRDIQYMVPGLVIAGMLETPENNRSKVVELTRLFVVGSRADASREQSKVAIQAVERLVSIIQNSPPPTDDIRIISGRIALLYQTSDACAALVGNSILEIAEHQAADPHRIVNQALAVRVPIRSTTRARLDEQVVLDLEAAHRAEPNGNWTFGYGAHACPGADLAFGIAVEIVRFMQEHRPIDLANIIRSGWEPLPNAWIPVLAHIQGGCK